MTIKHNADQPVDSHDPAVDEDTMPAEAAKIPAADVVLGANDIVTLSGGASAPSGDVHVVDGWLPVCGGERVRFRFPAASGADAVTCKDCAARIVTRRSAPRRSR